jgi:hypothetical protein
MMRRTQIYLDDETFRYLKKESEQTGKTMSEIIRAKVKDRKNRDVQQILRSTDNVFGIWKDRKFSVDHYMEEMRKDRAL